MAKLAYEETFDCVQCGYCLPACPTYQTMEKETHSPRGRINLVKMAAEGKVSLEDLKEPIDLCLGCRACETACPTNVQYGRILDSAKEVLAEETKKSIGQRTVESALFRKLLPSDRLLTVAGAGLYAYQKTGMQKLAQKSGVLSFFLPEGMNAFEAIMPTVLPPRRKERKRVTINEEPTYKIGYFLGCLMDTMFADINNQAMTLLEKAGCHVEILGNQACCGALQNHGGDLDTAKELAKKNIMAFEEASYDYIVSSIGGCGAMLMEYGELLDNEPEWRERGEAFAGKHADVSVILAECGLELNQPIRKTAVYQPSCHMTHVQKNVEAPLALIKSIPELTYKQVPKQDMCCGSAGIYNMLHFDEAMAILDSKMPHVESAQPELIITTNPGCHLQMKLGVERAGLTEKIEVKHLVEVLTEATREECTND